jgi:hypothetical protein
MALNFRIDARKTKGQGTTFQLKGDFDGSSAYELINILGDNGNQGNRVAINTDGLKQIHDFGVDVFLLKRAQLIDRHADIQVTGRFSHVFGE